MPSSKKKLFIHDKEQKTHFHNYGIVTRAFLETGALSPVHASQKKKVPALGEFCLNNVGLPCGMNTFLFVDWLLGVLDRRT